MGRWDCIDKLLSTSGPFSGPGFEPDSQVCICWNGQTSTNIHWLYIHFIISHQSCLIPLEYGFAIQILGTSNLGVQIEYLLRYGKK